MQSTPSARALKACAVHLHSLSGELSPAKRKMSQDLVASLAHALSELAHCLDPRALMRTSSQNQVLLIEAANIYILLVRHHQDSETIRHEIRQKMRTSQFDRGTDPELCLRPFSGTAFGHAKEMLGSIVSCDNSGCEQVAHLVKHYEGFTEQHLGSLVRPAAHPEPLVQHLQKICSVAQDVSSKFEWVAAFIVTYRHLGNAARRVCSLTTQHKLSALLLEMGTSDISCIPVPCLDGRTRKVSGKVLA